MADGGPGFNFGTAVRLLLFLLAAAFVLGSYFDRLPFMARNGDTSLGGLSSSNVTIIPATNASGQPVGGVQQAPTRGGWSQGVWRSPAQEAPGGVRF